MQSLAGRAQEVQLAPRQPPAAREPQGDSGEQGTVPASGNDSQGSAGREDGAGRGGTAGRGSEQRAKHSHSSGARAFGITGVERGPRPRARPRPALVPPDAAAWDQGWVASVTSALSIPETWLRNPPAERQTRGPSGPVLPAPRTAAPGPGGSRSRGTSRHDPPPEPRTVPRAPEHPQNSLASAALPRPSRGGSPGTS